MARKKRRSKPKFQHRMMAMGKFLLLIGSLIAVGLSSAYMGMRLAVRGTEIRVPSIVILSVKEATFALDKLTLKIGVIGERFDPKIPEGGIISQHPRAGGQIKTSGEVQVVVSLGEKRNPVPDLRGSTLRVARLMVSQLGYELGNISQISVPGSAEQEVIHQFPPPNSRKTLSPRIDVLISSESLPRYVMPKVTGLGLNKAILLFERNGLKVGKVQYRSYPSVSRGVVVKQFPEPGHVLMEKGPINLEVAR